MLEQSHEINHDVNPTWWHQTVTVHVRLTLKRCVKWQGWKCVYELPETEAASTKAQKPRHYQLTFTLTCPFAACSLTLCNTNRNSYRQPSNDPLKNKLLIKHIKHELWNFLRDLRGHRARMACPKKIRVGRWEKTLILRSKLMSINDFTFNPSEFSRLTLRHHRVRGIVNAL